MRRLVRVSRVLCAVAALAVIDGHGEASALMAPLGVPVDASDNLQITPSPVVAMNTNGDFVVVWSTLSTGGGDFDIFAHRFDRTGKKQGDKFQVNTITYGAPVNQTDPSVAFIGNSGNFVIVWTARDSNYAGIRGNVFDDNNNRQLAQEAVFNDEEEGDQRKPAVTGTNAGFIVAWEHFPVGADGEIRVRIFNSNGTASPGGSVVTTSFPFTPDIDVADDGSFVVVWGQSVGVPPPPDSDIFARRFNSNGSAAGTAFMVNSSTTERQVRPHVQVAAGGEFVVAWDLGTGFLPSFQKFDPIGNKIIPPGEKAAAERHVPSPQPGFIDLALAADGSFATVYVSPGGLAQIAGLLFDSTGTTVIDSNLGNASSEFLVLAPPNLSGTYPTIATDGSDLYVVAYGDNGGLSTEPHAAARLFTITHPSCGDPAGNGSITASDGLLTLRAAVSSASCALCLCDINDSGTITASDALAVLRAAVHIIVSFSCPACI